jgi:hypothetical protein
MAPSVRRRFALAAALAAALAGAAAALAGGGDEPSAEEARLRKAVVEAEIEAAASGDLYLVLVPAASRLDVRCEGMLLKSFPAAAARFAPAAGEASGDRWPAIAYRLKSELDLVRPEIIPPTPGAEPPAKPPELPTTPTGGIDFAARHRRETLDRAPGRYVLRFAPDLDLEVRGLGGREDEPVGFFARLGQRLAGGWRTIRRWFPSEPLPPRVVLDFSEDEAKRLFLALEPEIRLLVDLTASEADDAVAPPPENESASGASLPS